MNINIFALFFNGKDLSRSYGFDMFINMSVSAESRKIGIWDHKDCPLSGIVKCPFN